MIEETSHLLLLVTHFPRPITASDIGDRFSSGMLSDRIVLQRGVLTHFGR